MQEVWVVGGDQFDREPFWEGVHSVGHLIDREQCAEDAGAESGGVHLECELQWQGVDYLEVL